MTPTMSAPVALTVEPPNPRLPRGSRRLALIAALCVAWVSGGQKLAHADEADGRRLAGYTFSVAACTPDRAWCSEILADPTIRSLEACKALAPVFDGPLAHRRVLGGVSPDKMVLAWSCTPRFELPEA